jgi:ribosomal protein S18 acetylase RimI-like enzyme
MPLMFRPARADDVYLAVPLIYSSGPASFDYIFHHPKKGRSPDFLRAAFVDKRGEFSYSNHTVVEQNGQIVGVGACFSGDSTLAFTVAAALQIFRFYGAIAAWPVIVKGLQAETVIHPPTSKEIVLAHLGVAPEAQGQGIGTALVEHFLSWDAAKGKTPALDVAVTNPRAQALYERLGFVVVGERQSTLKNEHGVIVNHRRMEKKI